MEARLIALKLVLSELGIPEDIETVNDRKLLQKAIYASQATGVDLGYRYNWYLMGPYSPSLTRDYYELAEALGGGNKDYEGVELKASVRKALSRIKSLFRVPEDVPLAREDWLELISSLHFLRKVSGYSKSETHKILSKEKPHLVEHGTAAETTLKEAKLL